MDDLPTNVLARASQGDPEARNLLFELLYADLHRRAHVELINHSANTLSTTALVHEVYLKLFDKPLTVGSRTHFFRLAARVMRQVLMDHVRARVRVKRGGGLDITLLDDVDLAGADQFPLIALDRAMNQLQAFDSALAELTELHVFAGLGFHEIAELLGISDRSVYRDWRMARVFLRKVMGEGAD